LKARARPIPDKGLSLDGFAEIGKQIIDRNQLSGDATPDNLAVLVDQEVITPGTLVRFVQRAKPLDHVGIDVAEESVLCADRLLELLLGRTQVARYGNDFNIEVVELLLISTELGVFGRSTFGEGGWEKGQQHLLFACKIFQSEGRPARRQFEIR